MSGPRRTFLLVDVDAIQATPKVADDICAAFDIDKHGVFRTTTYRSNLSLQAKSFKTGTAKEADLKSFLKKHPGPSIVYVQTHDQTELLCTRLKNDGLNAYNYHAGMSSDARTTVQDNFMASDKIVVSIPETALLQTDDAKTRLSDRGHNSFWHGHRQIKHSQHHPLCCAKEP